MSVFDDLFPCAKDVKAVLVIGFFGSLANARAQDDPIVEHGIAVAEGWKRGDLTGLSLEFGCDGRRKGRCGRGRGGYNGSNGSKVRKRMDENG